MLSVITARRMQRWTRRSIAVFWITGGFAASCSAPGEARPPEESLRETLATSSRGFTYLSSVRELSDGRVLVTDPRENVIAVLSPALQVSADVARVGDGPREFSNAFPLRPGALDSSVMVDPLARRLSVFDGVRLVETRGLNDLLVGGSGAIHLGIDALGRHYLLLPPSSRSGDSAVVVRVDWRTRQADSVARLRGADQIELAAGEAESALVLARPALSTEEQAVPFSDGRLMIARLRPYRVESRSSDGVVTSGPVVTDAPAPFDRTERDFYLDRHAEAIRAIEQAPPSVRRHLGLRYTEFPDHLPPFLPQALVAAESGELLVRRTPSARVSGTLYDVFSRKGVRSRQVRLPVGERVVGVTRRGAYVVRRDSLDLEWLDLRRWPSG